MAVSGNIKKQTNRFVGQADKLQTLIKAAGIVDVEPIWTSIFAKVRRRTNRPSLRVPLYRRLEG